MPKFMRFWAGIGFLIICASEGRAAPPFVLDARYEELDALELARDEQGKLVRGHMGVEGEGTLYEFGEPLPEERPVYEGSIVREGQRLFRTEFEGEVSEVDSSAVGETLAFAVSARLLGEPFDQLGQAVATEVELFERVAKPVWKRLLGLR